MSLNRSERIQLLGSLGANLASEGNPAFQRAREEAYATNPWFEPRFIDQSAKAIAEQYLNESALEKWAMAYPEPACSRNVGLIMAGNIPLVGMHDLLAVFLSGHRASIKLSSKDEVLMTFILDFLIREDARSADYFQVTERLKAFDAVIATGSNNTSRYFEYYFGKYPHIIRKNRNGVAILTGEEIDSDLEGLRGDITDYFGLGCRNVTKLYVPPGYDFGPLVSLIDELDILFMHHKYRNNYDYHYALYLLNKDPFIAGKNILVKEDPSYVSRIACLNFEYYTSLEELKAKLEADADLIQCIGSKEGNKLGIDREFAFGKAQSPGLFDYADGVDTMDFLTRLT